MAEVFLSYKRADLARADAVRRKLTELGVDLFIDQDIAGGADYLAVINREIDSAAAVLALWTKSSVILSDNTGHNFFFSEVQRGHSRGVLVTAIFDKINPNELPVPFNLSQASDLSDWMPEMSAKHLGWQRVLNSLGRKLERPGLAKLALVFENRNDEARREFLHAYPTDPMSQRFASEIENFERKAFEKRVTWAKRQFDTRTKKVARDSDARLIKCREEFEEWLDQLRAGHICTPPDPKDAFRDRTITDLEENLHNFESLSEEHRLRAEKAEREIAGATSEAAALKKQVDRLQARTAEIESSAAQSADLQSRLAALGIELAEKSAAIVSEAEKAANSEAAATKARSDLEEKDLEVSNIKGEVDKLGVRVKQAEARLAPYRVAVPALGVLLCAAFFAFLFNVGRGNELEGRRNELASERDARNAEIAKLKREQDLRTTELAKLKRDQEGLLAQFKAVSAEKSALLGRIDRLASENKKLSEDIVAMRNANTASDQKTLTSQRIARCDELTAYRYDPDRPLANGWREDDHSGISVRDAMAACEAALKIATDVPTKRRITTQVGRIHAGLAAQQNSAGDQSSARRSMEAAVRNWQSATDMGSGQASFLLGLYFHRRDFAIQGFDPKDLDKAWQNYQQSVQRRNPYGLTMTASILQSPEILDRRVKRDDTQARRNLEAAIRHDYPRAFFMIGSNLLEGNDAYTKNPDAGVALIAVAYCKRDVLAVRFFDEAKTAYRSQRPSDCDR